MQRRGPINVISAVIIFAISGCSQDVMMHQSASEDQLDKQQTVQLRKTKRDLDILASRKPKAGPVASGPLSALRPAATAKSQISTVPRVIQKVVSAASPPSQPRALISGLGYAQVSNQPGKTLNTKRLMALRAARMEAMRDLTEQVHGLRLNSDTTVRDAVLASDVVRGTVSGEIRGARTVRIIPKDHDSFEVVLELSPRIVSYILAAARKSY